jgi:hypothetical protein
MIWELTQDTDDADKSLLNAIHERYAERGKLSSDAGRGGKSSKI